MSLVKKIIIMVIIEVALIGGWFLIVDKPSSPDLTAPEEVAGIDQEQNNTEETADDEETESADNTSEEEQVSDSSGTVLLEGVSFTPQAPFGNWNDPRQQDGCEEAAALMAVRWARGQSLTLAQAESEITAASDWELANYGGYHDTSVADTISRIFKGYFNYSNVEARYGISAQDIIRELEKGNLVIVPTDGRILNNPYFTPPGPERHMFVIKGYDYETGEFIVNDNGTRRGESMRYSRSNLFNAVMDYPTGYHEPMQGIVKAMIVVRK